MNTPSRQQGIQDELLELPGTTEERLNSSSSGSGYYEIKQYQLAGVTSLYGKGSVEHWPKENHFPPYTVH